MRKRLTAALLCLCMMLTLLPGTAYAAVGELLGNSRAENQALLEQLEALNGQDGEAIQALLEQYGLLDEYGNLDIDQTVELDGDAYTLAEIEALLDDPDADLSRVGYVDGVPIALGDLKTIIAIERELQRIQETYFSGKAFDGESLANLNSLVAQLQTTGITLRSAGVGETLDDVPALDVDDFSDLVAVGTNVTKYIPVQRVGQEFSVTVTLDPGLLTDINVRVTLGSTMSGVSEADTVMLDGSNNTATLTCTANNNDKVVFGGVPLSIMVVGAVTSPDYAYGELAAAVRFTDPQGFVFESGGQYYDAHTLRLTQTVDVPDLSTKWMQTDWMAEESQYSGNIEEENKHKSTDVYFEFLTYVTSSSNEALGITNDAPTAKRETINEFIRFLQGAKGYTDAESVPDDDAVQFRLTVGNLSARCNSDIMARAWDVGEYGPSNMFFLPEEEDADVDRVDLQTTYYGMDYSFLHINVGTINQITTPLQFDASTKLGTEAVPARLEVRGGIYVIGVGEGAAAYNYGILKDTAVELINDGKAPTLKSATTPSGSTYRPGQLVPVVLSFDELVYVNDDASISINDKAFTPGELHMSKAGNQLIFWYPVQKVDGAQVTITSLTGVTDIFGNAAEINGVTASGAALESALLREAATGVSVSYEEGQATVTVTLSDEEAYKNKYASYHQPASGEAQEVPFQAVVTNSAGTVIATEQVYVNEDGETFATNPFAVNAGAAQETYTVTLQVNEGTRETPDWVDLSYHENLKATFGVGALVQAASVKVSDDSDGNYTLSLADTIRPTLTAKVYGSDGSTLARSQSGTWSSSDVDIATITTEADYSGKVTLTGQKLGEVTFTFTADNGTPDDPSDDKTGTSQPYTVTAGDSLALVIPEGASIIVARQNAAATVLWSSNAALFAPDADFQYTIEVFYGHYTTEEALEAAEAGSPGKTPVATYTAAKDQNSVVIPENVLSGLSNGDTPAYTVRVSMPHPSGSGEGVRLSALAWIVVNPEPAQAVLTRPESIYLLDSMGSVAIPWSVDNYNNQTTTLTVIRVTGDDQPTTDPCTLSGGSGIYTLNLSQVADGALKDTYQIMLSVDNGSYESPSTDSFPLYVYNADALKIVGSEDQPITELTLDNTDKVSGDLPTDTTEILAMRQELGLLDYIGINYNDYSWNSFKDGIAWATDNDAISVNYKQGGMYEDIKLFGFDTYLPELKMGVATVENGTATITATHAATGMSASIPVVAHTLRDQFYLFQVTPAVQTTLRYTNGNGEERTVTTNSDGVLALYEPSGIASDVWLSSKDTDGTEYLGTIYNYDLQSGEGDARKLQLYPLNTFRLREAAKAELTLVTPDGSPYTGTVTVRGGVYKNGYFCETAGLGTTRQNIGGAGAAQQDTTFTADANGKITVYFDFTQFWSAEAGEDKDDLPTAVDKIQYVLEIRDIGGNAYYPLFQMVDGTVSPMQEMRTASGVVVLEAVPEGEENKPFVARQVVDYHLNDGALIDTRHSTGFVGPNYNFKEAVLTTNMLLWGETGDGASYTLTMADENGYVPEAQVSTGADRYPFTSMPVVENTLTLSEETMTTSGWILDGKDVGLKTRLTQNGSMVQERTMPFRAVDLSRVPPVQEDENVTGMVVTLTESSGWQEDINFGNGGSSIFNALLGDLGELTGPVDTSVFQMLITPSEDPSVFNALIWAGYDSLDLKDVEYKDGVAVSANFMTKGLETDMPSVGDLQEMASGSYDPMGAYNPSRSNRLSDVAGFDFGVQLEGYYEAEIRYNRDAGQWEVCTKGGGFTAGVGMEFGFSVNTVVGIVPVTGSFEVGGAMQLSLQAATRYSQQKDTDGTELVWNDPTATAVTDFLTNLRLRAYVEAFGGFGFDYSLIALKIGLFGKLDVNSENSFLSREYLADESKQQLNGQYLDIQSEVGIKFEAVFALISYEKVLASGSFGYGKSFNNWDEISDYWENTGTGLDSQSIQYAAAMGGLREVSSTATLQSRDYLEQYARSWGDSQARMSLFSLDEENGVENLQTNANPASFPELSDDGQVLVYVSDGYDETTNPAPSIYDSRAHYSILGDDGSYITSRVFPDGGFAGYGDSDVDVAGILKTDYIGGNATAAAAWVRQGAEIPNKDAGDEITAAEQNLLMNSSEIMVSVWSKQYGSNTGSWTTTRLTENATPDLAPAVAVNGEGKAIVFWRSVYSADPESGLMDFSSQDQIMYSYYDGTKWSEAKMLYNGANGSVKGLQAAMLNNGAAIAVYTLDRTGASDGSGQEIGYTIVGVNGDLGPSMLVTSDGYLDENPQVAALSLHLTTGTNEQRFILGWHSQRGGVSDIQLLAVDEEGTISNTFPASLSALTSSGQANIGGDFRFARVWNSKTAGSGYADNLTILWSETVSDETTNGLMTAAHSELKAVRLLAEDTDNDYVVDDFFLTAPQMVAELPSNTLLDHFDAYVETSYADNSQHPIKAVLQATCYDQNKQETIESDEGNVILPGEETKLYTASHNFEPYGLEVEAIGVDYKNLMANSLTPIQFTVRNTGVNEVTDLTVTLAEGESATLTSLQPSESATLAVYHKIGETVSDVAYTITDAGSNITKSGTVYLDYPDIGISQMKVLEEKEGQRTIALTLYNASDAPLASGRTVKVAFYTDSLLTEAANVTYNDNSGSNTITLSGNDLARIDAGACTLVLTYNVKDYVENTLGGQEIPDSGVYLYAEAWAEGKIGTQSEAKRLPEVHSSDNQSAVLLTGAYARTGEKTTLDVVQTNGTSTTATVSLKNNSLQQQSTATLVATLLDENGAVLETHSTGISGVLNGEAEQTADVQFSLLGSRVVVHAAASGEDSLTFDGLPVSMENFVQGPDGAYTHAIYGVTATGTLVTAISGNGETVTIDGEAVNSKQVSIVDNPQTITVKIGDNTYQLTIHSDAAPPATEVTVTFDANGGSVSPASAVTVNGKLASLPTPTREGYDFDGWFTAESGGEKVTASTVFTQNTTIYARWMEEEEPDHGGGSGGGGSTSSYRITVEDSSNGEVTANRETASAGSTITLTVTPDDGYQLAGLTVTGRNGKEITLKDKGDGSYTFTMPSSTVTVEAMFTPIVTEPLHFTDVSDGSYYYDAVNWAVSNGITDGTSATTFSPDNICTRAQMVTFLWRAAGSPAPHSGSNPFVDVPADAYYYTAVLWAVEQGITTGTSVTTFSPDDTVTRSQTVTFLWRYSGSPEAGGSSFADVEADAYYATAVAWAAGEGITSGTSATTFSPYDPCTRAQIVTFLYRAQ